MRPMRKIHPALLEPRKVTEPKPIEPSKPTVPEALTKRSTAPKLLVTSVARSGTISSITSLHDGADGTSML
jgi:hypothetical protein